MHRSERDRAAFEGKRRGREAASMYKKAHRKTIRIPVNKTGVCFLAEAERNTLNVNRAFVLHAHGVSQFVDVDGVGIGRKRLFVAFQRGGFGHAVANQLLAQSEGDLVALALGGFILQLDDGVRRRADERCNRGRLADFDSQLLGPQFDSQCIVHAIGRDGHFGLL